VWFDGLSNEVYFCRFSMEAHYGKTAKPLALDLFFPYSAELPVDLGKLLQVGFAPNHRVVRPGVFQIDEVTRE